MRRTEVLQEIREMRFEEVYFGWSESWLSQEEAALVLGVSDRTFRRYINRYEEMGDSGVTVGSRTRFRQGDWLPRLKSEVFIVSIWRELRFPS